MLPPATAPLTDGVNDLYRTMPRPPHTVSETAPYLARCDRLGLTPDERARIVDQVAADPSGGDVVRGSGGVRKVRFGGSGGYRVMVAYLGDRVPAYLLSILSKGQQASFTKAQIEVMHGLTKSLKRQWSLKLKEGRADD
ncbi:addiction module toxin RelE [Methylobacterium sp. WL119]|uniref:addiction module toxin RelE n=1 Tax=unclassified Methylobacterium TaxID=2615210 RepID=UPI0011CADD1B|nr:MULTISPECIES: addiction module toxin RelE [unclassified Methylobacterium]TXN46200.1 addiction module toxin RelE [Methylobacterium sp. WL119]